MKITEAIEIEKKIKRIQKMISRLLSVHIVISILSCFVLLFLFGSNRLNDIHSYMKWFLTISALFWLVSGFLRIKIIFQKQKLYQKKGR